MMRLISCIQYRPRLARCRADVGDNLRRATPLLDQAARIGSHLIVLPELCFTGYSFLERNEVAQIAERFDGPTFLAMRSIAIQAMAYVSWGYPEVDENGSLYNSGSVVAPNGDLVTRYRKINLWGNDFFWAISGTEAAPIVQTDIGLLSLIICRDLRDKIPANIPRFGSEAGKRHYEGRRVDVVAASTDWGKGGFPANAWMDFAADNRCILAVANRWGEEKNASFIQDFGQGGSIIIEPNWKVHIGGLEFGANCVVSAHIV
jgi:predicted amidohydrolase